MTSPNVPSLTHATRHATGGADALTPAQIGAEPAGLSTASKAAVTAQLNLTSQAALTESSRLLPWFAALANRKNKRANVVVIGDSIIEGYPVTSFDRTVTQQLAANLRAAFPTTATGGRGFIGPPSAFFLTGTPAAWPLAFTGGTLDDTTYGFGAKHRFWFAVAAGNKCVLTLASPVTSFDLNITLNNLGAAAAGYYKIDSGSQVTFNTYAATNQSSTLHVASAATSTIEVGVVASPTGYVEVEGITEYKGDESTGIQVHNCAYSGYTAAQFNVLGSVWASSVKMLNPDLAIISLGANDASTSAGNRTSVQFKSDLTTTIANLRGAGVSAPIVLSMMWDSPVVKVEPWANYVAAAKAIAAADSTVVCVDHSARMPVGGSAQAVALGIYYGDNAHGAANGNAYMFLADSLAAAISPR